MFRIVLISLVVAVLTGCATANYETGRDFSKSQVESIVEGATTKSDISSMFGTPYSVSIHSGSEVWFYQYIKTSSHAQNMIFVMDVKTSSQSKMLTITFADDLVTRYSYSESPAATMNVN